MTTLIAWLGVDNRTPSSLYIASDSRISWEGKRFWDCGRKLFVAKTQPHMLGYCGDVLFPTQVLSQIVELIDSGLLLDQETNPEDYLGEIIKVMTDSLAAFPSNDAYDFSILYGTRFDNGVGCTFSLFQVDFHDRQPVNVVQIPLTTKSDVLCTLGSGAKAFRDSYDRWLRSDVGGTSRSVFSALTDSLLYATDPLSGGPPQLVGLYRQWGGKTFGVVYNGKRYFYGTEVKKVVADETVKWHNELFEICDPHSVNRKPTAQPQPRPRKLEHPKKKGAS